LEQKIAFQKMTVFNPNLKDYVEILRIVQKTVKLASAHAVGRDKPGILSAQGPALC
jgi:hypothetical protein